VWIAVFLILHHQKRVNIQRRNDNGRAKYKENCEILLAHCLIPSLLFCIVPRRDALQLRADRLPYAQNGALVLRD
jgi:hypothetical protein